MFSIIPNVVLAQGQVWSGKCVNNGVATIQGLECLFANILGVITALAGFVALGMFIVGGFQYLSSQGDQKGLATANSTLTNAILGLIGVIVSALILKLIAEFTGAKILDFQIPS